VGLLRLVFMAFGTDTDYCTATNGLGYILRVDAAHSSVYSLPAWAEAYLQAAQVDQVVAGGGQALVGTVKGVRVAGLGGRGVGGVSVGPDADGAVRAIWRRHTQFGAETSKLSAEFGSPQDGDLGGKGFDFLLPALFQRPLEAGHQNLALGDLDQALFLQSSGNGACPRWACRNAPVS